MSEMKATVEEQAQDALRIGTVFELECALRRALVEGVGGETFKPTLRDGSPSQISVIANYIMAEIPGEPSRSEGAGDTAVRLMKKYRQEITGLKYALEMAEAAEEIAQDERRSKGRLD